MDRTMIAPWKAEEKEQSEKLHKKLKGLSLIYPMNEEMLKLLSWDMFLKSNQAAFFQVMHYLFRILDPAEFKRRFYWPITDKKSEANFRSSTVDYLKHLNEKHQLNWTNIKSYLVVMPGGMKFINFVLDLVGFVVKEMTKQREKVLLVDMGMDAAQLRDLSVDSMARQNSLMKEYASAYIDELKEATTRYRETTKKIGNIFLEIASKAGISESQLLDDKFLEKFEAHNRQQCEKLIINPTQSIASLEAAQYALKEAMDCFLAKQSEQNQNKEAAEKALANIQKLIGMEDTSPANDRINGLLAALLAISETVAEQLDAHDHYNESNELVTKDLQDIRDQVQQMDLQGSEVQRNLIMRARETNPLQRSLSRTNSMQVPVLNTPLRSLNPTNNSNEHPLLPKFVSTPPIKLEISGGLRSLRLPLQDDFNVKQFESNLLEPIAPSSARRPPMDQSGCDLNNTMNRPRILDGMQMLRTIYKKSAKSQSFTQTNLSALGSKWKQMQASFGFDETPRAAPTSPKPVKGVGITNQSPFTPLSCHEQTRIERVQGGVEDTSASSLYAKKSTAMLKVLSASVSVHNLSTSPSGRLDALVPGPSTNEQRPIPQVLLNNLTLNESLSDNKEVEVEVNQLNQLLTNMNIKDDLLNISDSVLNDITF